MKRTILVIFFLIYAFYNCVGETVEPASDVSDSMANRDDINPADTEEDFGRDTSATDISSKDTSVSDIYDSGIYEDIYVGDIFPSDTVDLADSNTDISDTSDATTDISPDTSLSDTGTNNSSVKIIFPDTYECENPCTFRVEASENIVKVRYLADDKWEIGKSENRSNGFEIQYRFTTLGKRVIYAYAYESKDENAQIVASDNREYLIKEAKGNKFGVWLWYIEGTGLTHTELAQRLSALGVKRIFVKVADGPADCTFNWPEGCDMDIPLTYKKYGIECWAWSYNYPGDEMNQADALYNAAYVGYDGYVLDIETEFDNKTTELETLLKEFKNAKSDAIQNQFITGSWPVYVTTWGNPKDHKMHVEIIDKYVDGHMPQTYLEVWGQEYMNDPAKWVKAGTCEYRELGATKPIYHIVSTEYDKITATQINTFFKWSGKESSIWRVPGTETPLSIWETWNDVDWKMDYFEEIVCP